MPTLGKKKHRNAKIGLFRILDYTFYNIIHRRMSRYTLLMPIFYLLSSIDYQYWKNSSITLGIVTAGFNSW